MTVSHDSFAQNIQRLEKNTWHKVKVIRNTDSGDIAVWFDDTPAPILAARDEGRFRTSASAVRVAL